MAIYSSNIVWQYMFATLTFERNAQFQVSKEKAKNALSTHLFDAISSHCVLVGVSSVHIDTSTQERCTVHN